MADPTRPGGPPPPGPGVQPPFVAPPIEGRGVRLGISLGLAGGLLVACCGLGGLSLGGLLLLGEGVINEQAQRAVDDYLTALSEREWETAYDVRCQADRDAEPLSAFTQREQRRPGIDEYSLRDLRIAPGGNDAELTVPAEVSYDNGTDTVLEVPVSQNPQTGTFEVCGPITEA